MEPSELLLTLQTAPDLAEALLSLGDVSVDTVEEARGVCQALGKLGDPQTTPCGKPLPTASDALTTPLTMLASLFQRVGSHDALEVLGKEGLPLLIERYDARANLSEAHPDRRDEDLMFLLKIFAMYGSPEGLDRIVGALRTGIGSEDYLWEVIFRQYDDEHPQRLELCERLTAPLPQGFAAVAYLDFVNGLSLAGELDGHPFDSEPGRELLEGWLLETDEEKASFAHSATASLPFLARPDRDRLLALALDHTSARVQLEAAWASGRIGSSGGIKLLARHCLDSRTSSVAQAYLRELDRADAIPPETEAPAFAAEAEMCSWLSHPHEFGRPPESIVLKDSRSLFWPPTNDERQLWLFEYAYPPKAEGEDPVRGVGMVGSITFALFGETNPEQSAEDVYALHCCWELEVHSDPRAPETRSIEAGRALLDAPRP